MAGAGGEFPAAASGGGPRTLLADWRSPHGMAWHGQKQGALTESTCAPLACRATHRCCTACRWAGPSGAPRCISVGWLALQLPWHSSQLCPLSLQVLSVGLNLGGMSLGYSGRYTVPGHDSQWRPGREGIHHCEQQAVRWLREHLDAAGCYGCHVHQCRPAG